MIYFDLICTICKKYIFGTLRTKQGTKKREATETGKSNHEQWKEKV